MFAPGDLFDGEFGFRLLILQARHRSLLVHGPHVNLLLHSLSQKEHLVLQKLLEELGQLQDRHLSVLAFLEYLEDEGLIVSVYDTTQFAVDAVLDSFESVRTSEVVRSASGLLDRQASFFTYLTGIKLPSVEIQNRLP